MLRALNPFVRYVGAVKVSRANTIDCVGKENRLFYFTSGEASLVIAGKTYSVSKNTLAYIPSYVEYRFDFAENDDVTLVCVNFDVVAGEDAVEEHTRPIELALWDGDTSDGERLPEELSRPIVLDAAEAVQKDITKISKLFFSREPYYAEYSSVYMKRVLLFALTRACSDPSAEPAVRILEYVREHYRYRIRNADLARRFGYHPNHLNRVVKSYTGLPLKAYIIAFRLAAARELLATTDDPITEISENCGFSTPSYFTELFSKNEGITPREYRSRIRNTVI